MRIIDHASQSREEWRSGVMTRMQVSAISGSAQLCVFQQWCDPGKGAPGRMSITGQEWRDLATGASLRLTAKASAQFTRQGQATDVAYQTDEVLDLARSQL